MELTADSQGCGPFRYLSGTVAIPHEEHIHRISLPIRYHRVLLRLEGQDGDPRVIQDVQTVDIAPTVGYSPDPVGSILLIRPISHAEGRGRPGAGTGQKNPIRVYPKVFPGQQIRQGLFQILHCRLLRRGIGALVQMKSQPVIHGHRHIAQRCKILAPGRVSRLFLISHQEGPPVQHHQQRAAFGRIAHRSVNIGQKFQRLWRLHFRHELHHFLRFTLRSTGPIPVGRSVYHILLHRHLIGGSGIRCQSTQK